MAVSYITVTPITNLFVPASRSYGDIAIVGGIDADAGGPKNTPIAVTDPGAVAQTGVSLAASAATPVGASVLTFAAVPGSITKGMSVSGPAFGAGTTVSKTDATTVTLSQNVAAAVSAGDFIQFINPNNGMPIDDPVWFKGDLARSVRIAFGQTPGPTTIWAIATSSAPTAIADGLAVAAGLNVQIVLLANTPLTAGAGKAAIEALASHCATVSKTGGDGMERIGVAMLGNGVTDATLISGAMSLNRMTMIAHTSTEDAAAAAAGVIAGYQPHISMLLKPIALDMIRPFSASEIDAFNAARINWVTRTPLLPGAGYYVGEGYTLGADQPYIDIVRTIDEISFDLKAALIRSIGVLRVTRAGLRALVSEMSAVLQPLQDDAVIDSYLVYFPLLTLLDKPPASLTDVELQMIHTAQATRSVASVVTIEYAGAIHRLNITLKFE